MEHCKAIAILARIQEPEAWEPQITREAWQALEMAKEALVKESQGLAKNLGKDVPDKDVGKCSEIPNSSDLNKFIDGLEEIFADLRERHGDDSVCGLCEHDGAYIGQSGDWCNECPGFEKDDCFKLSDECRKRWIDTITNSLPPAEPEQQNARIFQEIVVEYPSYNTYPEYEGKPYFSIKYTEDGQDFIGYGTYKPEVLSQYLKEYFMPSTQSEIIRCKECTYGKQDEYGRWYCIDFGCQVGNEDGSGFCSDAERRTNG